MKNIQNFWTENWKWLIGTVGVGLFLTGLNFGIMQERLNAKPSLSQTQSLIIKKINNTIIPRIVVVEKSIKQTKIREKSDLTLLREIKFNLKALLNKQGITYIELK